MQKTKSKNTGAAQAKGAAASRAKTAGKKPSASSGKPAPKNNQKRAAPRADAPRPRRTGTKLSRLLELNPAAVKAQPAAKPAAKSAVRNAKPLTADSLKPGMKHWLVYCRPGFEQDCAQEAIAAARVQRPVLAEQHQITDDSGYAVVSLNEQELSFGDLIFVRQLISLQRMIDELPERDRLSPIVDAIASLDGNFGALWLEVPDTNDGKTLTAFTRRFQPLIENALANRLTPDASLPRLHLFFPDKSSVLIGTSAPYNSSQYQMGIVRQSMPPEAPSRSTLKLAEAIEVFMDKSEQTRLLRSGMTAVDLGAAPGGWTWQMVKRGIRVTAVDNGPMKGVMAKHPLVEHVKQDGFKFAPRRSVDWLICDMVEKPSKVAELVGNWFASGWCKHAIFNLKLPMKQRVPALDAALSGIRAKLDMEAIGYRMTAKQLYHDREEITVFLTRIKNR